MRMFNKIAGLVVSAIFALTTPVAILASPPPYAFGGGERAVHINTAPPLTTVATAANSTQSAHIATTPPGYEYGAFLGVLSVERLGRTVNIYGGATMAAMDYGAGHFSFTGLHYGNVGLIGHNRGARNGFFSFVRLLQDGDIMRLYLGDSYRTFEVFKRTVINETDFSPLQQFGDNRITLITCVEYVRNHRRVAVAREVLEGELAYGE